MIEKVVVPFIFLIAISSFTAAVPQQEVEAYCEMKDQEEVLNKWAVETKEGEVPETIKCSDLEDYQLHDVDDSAPDIRLTTITIIDRILFLLVFSGPILLALLFLSILSDYYRFKEVIKFFGLAIFNFILTGIIFRILSIPIGTFESYTNNSYIIYLLLTIWLVLPITFSVGVIRYFTDSVKSKSFMTVTALWLYLIGLVVLLEILWRFKII